jgi:uncharacterized protein (TIGR03083 family)
VSADLTPYVSAWQQTTESLSALCARLSFGDWERATECPGWSVRDVVSHVIALESELLGDPRPIHSLPSDLRHVRSEFNRYMEVPVDYRRCHTPPEMVGELEHVLIRRNRALTNETRGLDEQVRGLMGTTVPLGRLLRTRVCDIWAHEQDVRRAVGQPGNLDGPAALIARDRMLETLPKAVAREAKAPSGTTVALDVSGPVEFLRTIEVGADGRGVLRNEVTLAPTVRLITDWETFVRLTCGRVRPEVADVKPAAPTVLTRRIMANLTVAP